MLESIYVDFLLPSLQMASWVWQCIHIHCYPIYIQVTLSPTWLFLCVLMVEAYIMVIIHHWRQPKRKLLREACLPWVG